MLGSFLYGNTVGNETDLWQAGKSTADNARSERPIIIWRKNLKTPSQKQPQPTPTHLSAPLPYPDRQGKEKQKSKRKNQRKVKDKEKLWLVIYQSYQSIIITVNIYRIYHHREGKNHEQRAGNAIFYRFAVS